MHLGNNLAVKVKTVLFQYYLLGAVHFALYRHASIVTALMKVKQTKRNPMFQMYCSEFLRGMSLQMNLLLLIYFDQDLFVKIRTMQ